MNTSVPLTANGRLPGEPPKRSWLSLIGWGAFFLILVWSWGGADMRPLDLFRDSGNMSQFAHDFFPPDFKDWRVYVHEMLVTIHIAVWGTALAVVCSIPMGLLSASNMVPAWVYQPVRRVMDACRAINEMVFAMLFIVAVGLGLLGAWAKLSASWAARLAATAYTTLIRGVPDLVLMLLIFFSMQIYLNDLTDLLGLDPIDIDPFGAGVLTLGFIYGAYFAETFRGAFMAVPYGQMEAATAYGMREFQVFRRVLFPQMMRHALPGIGNNWQVLLKSTALVSLIGLSDLVKVAQDAGNVTFRVFLFISLTGLIYLALTTLSNGILYWLDRRYSVGVREVQL